MLKTTLLRSIDELQARAAAWDDLWRRGDDTLATSRAEPLAVWLDHFADGRMFRAVIVEDGARMLAALPLYDRPLAGPFHAGALPANEWPGGGALLWDRQCDDPDVAQRLIDGLSRLPWSLLLLEGVLPQRASWQRFVQALQSRRVACDLRTRWQAARKAIGHDWPAAVAELSRKHRQRIAAAQRKLDSLGGACFERVTLVDDASLEQQLLDAFCIEEYGWKGDAGTAVLRVPGVFSYLVRACRAVANQGHAQLAVLRADQTPIAFCLGIVSQGVWHSCKIGYDAAFAEVMPGHLLHYRLLEALHNDGSCQAIDYMGPATEYHRHWDPEVYPVARLAVAPRGLLGKLALWGYERFKGPANGPVIESVEVSDAIEPAFEVVRS